MRCLWGEYVFRLLLVFFICLIKGSNLLYLKMFYGLVLLKKLVIMIYEKFSIKLNRILNLMVGIFLKYIRW